MNYKILFFYTQLLGYQVSTIQNLVNLYSCKVVVVSWDNNNYLPYKIPQINSVRFYKKSEFNLKRLIGLIEKFGPDIIVTSGWIEKDYNKACKYAKKRGIKTVAATDTQWKSSFRHKMAVLISKFYHRRYFNYTWVAGIRQFEYAKRLGFFNNQILINCLSADLSLFNEAFELHFKNKKKNYPKELLFVGRFSKEKGIENLIKTFNILSSNGFNWNLTLVGGGPIDLRKFESDKIKIINYVQPKEMISIIKNSGVFILPGTEIEPWGLVIQEFAAAGLPIICSDKCGAATEFVINNYNGFTFDSEKKDALHNTLLKLNKLNHQDLFEMGQRSHKLAQRITPETAAANLMSIL